MSNKFDSDSRVSPLPSCDTPNDITNDVLIRKVSKPQSPINELAAVNNCQTAKKTASVATQSNTSIITKQSPESGDAAKSYEKNTCPPAGQAVIAQRRQTAYSDTTMHSIITMPGTGILCRRIFRAIFCNLALLCHVESFP